MLWRWGGGLKGEGLSMMKADKK